MRVALAELRQWVATTATLPAPAPAAASAMDTDFNEVVRKQKDTVDGLLSKFEFEGETEEKRTRKRSWGDRTSAVTFSNASESNSLTHLAPCQPSLFTG